MRVIMNVVPDKEWLGQHREIKYEITVVSSGSKAIQELLCACGFCVMTVGLFYEQVQEGVQKTEGKSLNLCE
jgi:hypothetical protein